MNDKTLIAAVNGRLDTLTAPDLAEPLESALDGGRIIEERCYEQRL